MPYDSMLRGMYPEPSEDELIQVTEVPEPPSLIRWDQPSEGEKLFSDCQGFCRPKEIYDMKEVSDALLSFYHDSGANDTSQAGLEIAPGGDSKREFVAEVNPEIQDEEDEEEINKRLIEEDENLVIWEKKGRASLKSNEERFLSYCDKILENVDAHRIEEFVQKYGEVIRESMETYGIRGKTKMYASHEYTSALPDNFLDLVDIFPDHSKIYECERMFVILYQVYHTNSHLSLFFSALLNGEDMWNYRALLTLGRSNVKNKPRAAGIYILRPVWSVVDKEQVNLRTKDYKKARYPAHATPSYIGMTQDMGPRLATHTRKAVNRRVEALKSIIPFEKWSMDLCVEMCEGTLVPEGALHLIEHFLIVVTRSTTQNLAGLNVNIVDSLRYQTLIAAKDAIRMVKVVDAVLGSSDNLMLPVRDDVEAWRQILKSAIPENCQASPQTLASIIFRQQRKHISDAAKPTNITKYLNRKEAPNADENRPATKEHLLSLKSALPSNFTTWDPERDLMRLVALFESIAPKIR
ncbi:hypothetical protein L486_04464 [Kwoniella mangroviensis CBS 10435]|uniref:Uncharacterized protein n=1 Tax=Kwoniella mangroviensis CBS 10435 TaxID=1331196 RepID=A0A1B9ISC8_9TREE|nr:hypothetical protein L486_04464 [Kwoniella mangroviensis CBS 10435]